MLYSGCNKFGGEPGKSGTEFWWLLYRGGCENAFNSAIWGRIKSGLTDVGIPGSSQRELSGMVRIVLDALLWNFSIIEYLNFPEEATIVGLADDLAVAVAPKHPENVEICATETVRAVKMPAPWFGFLRFFTSMYE